MYVCIYIYIYIYCRQVGSCSSYIGVSWFASERCVLHFRLRWLQHAQPHSCMMLAM